MDEELFLAEREAMHRKIIDLFFESELPPMIVCSLLCYYAGIVAKEYGACTDSSLSFLKSSMLSGLTGSMSFFQDEVKNIIEKDKDI